MADTFKGIITADGKKRQLPYENVLKTPVSDATLSRQGAFADAKAAGDKFKEVKAETASLKEDLADIQHEKLNCLVVSKKDVIWRNTGETSKLYIDSTNITDKSFSVVNTTGGVWYFGWKLNNIVTGKKYKVSVKYATDLTSYGIAIVGEINLGGTVTESFTQKEGEFTFVAPSEECYIRFATNASFDISNIEVVNADANKLKSEQLDKKIPTKTSELENDSGFISSLKKSDWQGKTVLFYGDSITAINNPNCPDGSWGAYIRWFMGLGATYGRGIGGQSYTWNTATFYANSDGSYNSRDTAHNPPTGTTEHKGCFCSWDRIKTMIPDNIKDTIDLIILMGGTNDIANVEEATGSSAIVYKKPVWSGDNQTDSDWKNATEYNGGDYDVTEFSGAIASTIMKLQIRCPNAIIVVCTPLSRWTNNQNTEYNGKNTKDVADVEIEVARYMAVPHIDVNGTCGINGFNYSTYITDSVHPYEVAGKKMLARTIIGGLKGIYPIIN